MFSQQIRRNLEQQRIMSILSNHADKNFVQRILNPEGKPSLDLGRGNFATHKMAWTTANGKPIVFPKVIQNQQTGQLQELPMRDAIQHALRNNEFIPMKNNSDAEWLSSNYKKVWDIKGKNNISLSANLRNFNPFRQLLSNNLPGGRLSELLGN